MSGLLQVNEVEWKEVANPKIIAVLPLRPIDLESLRGIKFREYAEDGLGRCVSAVIRINEIYYYLRSFPDNEDDLKFLSVEVRSFERDSSKALDELVDVLTLSRSDLIWEAFPLGPAEWSLIRLDDNGNEYEVMRLLDQSAANWLKSQYEATNHKQLYEVKNILNV